MHEIAHAKLNLALHVRAREPDGYHRLETIFAFAEHGDDLYAADGGPELELDVEGPFAAALEGDPSTNLVLRAAEALRAHYGIEQGVRLSLVKRLPVAAGIGGGSADAGAALRLLVRWWRLPWESEALEAIARGLGADVTACLWSRTARGEGRGDDLVPVDGTALSSRPVLLVNPLVPVPTGPVFRAWDGVDRGPLGAELLGRNDLQAPAIGIAPVIADVLAALADADFALMSGSGATCFGLYPHLAACAAAARRIAAEHPGWWVLETRLR